MLVLSRQRDETIMIGDDIEITIVDIRGDKVRLGITAPATIPVHRKEVYDAIQRENREAARVKMEDLGGLPKNLGKPAAVPPGLHRPQPPAIRPQAPGQAPLNGTSSGMGQNPPPSSGPPSTPQASASSMPRASNGNSAGSISA